LLSVLFCLHTHTHTHTHTQAHRHTHTREIDMDLLRISSYQSTTETGRGTREARKSVGQSTRWREPRFGPSDLWVGGQVILVQRAWRAYAKTWDDTVACVEHVSCILYLLLVPCALFVSCVLHSRVHAVAAYVRRPCLAPHLAVSRRASMREQQ